MIIKEPENVALKISDSTRKYLKLFFGKDVPTRKLAALVGALDDAVVSITPLGNGFISDSKHKYLIEQTRIGGGSEDLGMFIKNEFFQLTGDAPDKIGLISLVRQVVAARELGFAFIRTFAEGYAGDPDYYIGYYVWARFGFNAPLKEQEISNLPQELAGCADLTDLMLNGGHEWWKQNGSARDMIFPLSDDELSLIVLRNYSKEMRMETDL